MAEQEQAEEGNGSGFRLAVYVAQFFFGGWFFVHGLNHWFHFFPQPPGSSPQGAALIGALIDSGMFDLIKGMEVVTGALMLANRFVPLAIVLAFPVGVGIAAFDHSTNGDWFGTGTAVVILLMLGLMSLAYLDRFLPMLVANQGRPSLAGWRQLLAGGSASGSGAMRPPAHLVAIVLGIVGPVAFTLWSSTDYGPRSRAHYERAAAMRTDTHSVLERMLASEGQSNARIVAEGDMGLVLGEDGSAELFTVENGEIAGSVELVPQGPAASDEGESD